MALVFAFSAWRTAPTTDITVAAGECKQVTSQITVIPQTQQANLKVVAWAQERASAWPADVYQGAMLAWPFESPQPCPWDCADDSGDVGITDFLILLAQWGEDPGGPPDFDGSGDVGINDFLLLLAYWGPCP